MKEQNIPEALTYPNASLRAAIGGSAFVPESMFDSSDSRERFSMFADAIPHMVWTTDGEGRADYFNNRWTEFSGVSEQSLLRDGWLETVHPDDRARVTARWLESVRTGQLYEVEYRVRNQQGDYHPFIARGTPLFDTDGKIYRWIGTSTDMYDQRLLEEQQSALMAENERRREHLDLLVSNVPGIVWEALGKPDDGTQRMEFVSSYAEKMLGYQVSEWLSTPNFWLTIVHPEDREAAANRSRICFETGKSGTNIFRWMAKDGRAIWVESHHSIILDDAGTPIGMRGVSMEVTDRIEAERALRESDERFRAIADHAPVSLWLSDSEGKRYFFNRAWLDFVGSTLDENYGEGWQRYVHPEDIERCLSIYGQALQRREEYQIEFRLLHAKAGYRWILARGLPRFLDDGTFIGLVGCCVDITAHKEQEQANAVSHEHFRVLAESLPHIVWTTDSNGVPDYWNTYWFEYTGLTLEQSLKLSDRQQVFHIEDRATLFPLWQESILSEIPLFGEIRIRRKDGIYRWHNVSTIPVRNACGELICWVGSIIDIHDQKTANNDLMLAKEAADAANVAKDHFLATLSHELRTPLTPVLTTVETLELDDQLPDGLRPYIATIRRNVELEARLIDDLLDLTRITRGKIHLSRRTVDVHSLLSNVLEICRKGITNKRIEVRMSLHAEQVFVDADPARLQQIFWNILQNAVKFTPTEGNITVRTGNSEHSRLTIEISDSGIGIEPSHLAQIFRPFEQGDMSITRQFGGLGLGLAISKMLVDVHDGSIRATSSGRGQGSTFLLEFANVLPPPVIPDAIVAPTQLRQSVPGTKRLLLVDDHVDTNLSLKLLLERRGYHISTAESVETAMDSIAANDYHLLISDIGLPDGSGWDLIRKVRETSGVKAIALSGFCTEEDIKRSTEAGFNAHLTKPFHFPDLHKLIEQMLESA